MGVLIKNILFCPKIALLWLPFVSKSNQCYFVMRSKPNREGWTHPDEDVLHESRIEHTEQPLTIAT